ncbi:hypothetical protein FACS1894127_0070 [Clostridia bacterium]|nr:hypothetical protein FACS1894127_0070 [Clostridia bacterium]
MMTNEEMERLHTEPDGTDAPESTAVVTAIPEAAEESAFLGAELLAVLDVILGVNADG